MSNPILIIGWYGVGKTTYIDSHPEVDIVDLQGVANLEQLEANLDHKYVVADPDWLLVFCKLGRHFNIVVPELSRKAEFLNNYGKRQNGGSNHKYFINRRSKDWEERIGLMHYITNTTITVLEDGQFFGDVIDQLQ